MSANGTPLVRVGEHFSSKFDVSFRNAVSPWEDVALQMKSHGWSEKKWDITRKSTGQPLAFMKLDGHGGKKYELEVEAGTDLSLVSLCFSFFFFDWLGKRLDAGFLIYSFTKS